MILAAASSESSNRFELAAQRLLLCAQAAGAHHQTPMTRAQAASTRGAVQQMREPRCSHGKSGNELILICDVALFLVGLTAFLSAALTLAIHPFVAVLLALGAMELLLHSLGELLQVSQVEIEHSRPNRDVSDRNHY